LFLPVPLLRATECKGEGNFLGGKLSLTVPWPEEERQKVLLLFLILSFYG
jgi:hypothetical protein